MDDFYTNNSQENIGSGSAGSADNGNGENRSTNYGADSYSSYSYGTQTQSAESSYSNPYAQAAEPEKKKKKEKVKKEKTKGRYFPKLITAVSLGLAFGIFAAGGFYGVNQLIGEKAATQVESSDEVEELQKTVAELQNAISTGSTGTYTSTSTAACVTSDVTDVVDKVMPSMVSVSNKGEETYNYWGRTYTQETESSGSGIIVGESDTEYFIATNHHVIEDSKTLTVQFVNETTAEAYVKGYDSSKDIAVIAVAKSSLDDATMNAIAIAELGDSDSLKIGEPAIAIGNALGYGQSVTTGVISALDRSVTIDDTTFEGLIQTSAAINPGNSGGALLNVYGQVIGINSSKVGGDSVEGMGFAIPISTVKDIIEEFSARETRTKVDDESKGYLGIGGINTADYNLAALGYPEGVYIQKVYEGSAADEAGLYQGDIITKVDGQTITTMSELQELLSYYSEGETVPVTIYRNVDGSFTEIVADVTLGDKSSITTTQTPEKQ